MAENFKIQTAEDVAEIARSCELDAEYYLCGREDGADEPRED